jgi:hypothetical protein
MMVDLLQQLDRKGYIEVKLPDGRIGSVWKTRMGTFRLGVKSFSGGDDQW